jgi:hypothetical protein
MERRLSEAHSLAGARWKRASTAANGTILQLGMREVWKSEGGGKRVVYEQHAALAAWQEGVPNHTTTDACTVLGCMSPRLALVAIDQVRRWYGVERTDWRCPYPGDPHRATLHVYVDHPMPTGGATAPASMIWRIRSIYY